MHLRDGLVAPELGLLKMNLLGLFCGLSPQVLCAAYFLVFGSSLF